MSDPIVKPFRALAFFFTSFLWVAVASATLRPVHYELEISLDPGKQTVAGDEAITLQGVDGGETSVVLGAADIVVSAVSEDGVPLSFEQSGGRVRILFARAAAKGAERVVRILYAGKPARGLKMSAGQAFTAFHTDHWMVCDDDPAAKATLRLALIVPAGLEAVASGRPEGREDLGDGRTRYRFSLERPYSSYLFGFAVGAFREAGGGEAGRVALRYLSPSLTPEELARALRETPAILAFFEEHAGVPYPGDAYTQVLLPDGPAQEMANLSVMNDRYGQSVLDDPREDYLIAHELAHQWWGNLVTCRTWSDFWLNEGMATFMVAAFKERFWGRDEYERELGIARIRYQNALAKGEARPLVYTRWKSSDEMGGPVTYSRGALVLHLLRRELGDGPFWSGLREFTRAGAGSTVDSDALRVAMEKASGRDLRDFFKQWVYGTSPDLTARHRLTRGGVEIEIEQRQPEVWSFAVVVAVAGATRRETRRVSVTKRRETFRIPFDEPVTSVVVDAESELPDPIAHQRSPEMLLVQMRDEPDASVRIGAMRAAEKLCGTAARPASCDRFPKLLDDVVANDTSRLVRQIATQIRKQ
jgi:aminopeptidase N